MNTSQFLERLANKKTGYNLHELQQASQIIFSAMRTHLLKGENRIEIRGFGSFSVRTIKAKTGFDPRLKKTVPWPARKKIYYRPSQTLLQQLNPVPTT